MSRRIALLGPGRIGQAVTRLLRGTLNNLTTLGPVEG